jgi:hypothetical protein
MYCTLGSLAVVLGMVDSSLRYGSTEFLFNGGPVRSAS